MQSTKQYVHVTPYIGMHISRIYQEGYPRIWSYLQVGMGAGWPGDKGGKDLLFIRLWFT